MKTFKEHLEGFALYEGSMVPLESPMIELDEAEYNCLEVAVKELQIVRDSSTEHRVLMRQIESVGKVSEEFAARRMDASIKNALAGQSLDDVENTL